MSGGSGSTKVPHPEAPAVSSAVDQADSGVPCFHLDPFYKYTPVRFQYNELESSFCVQG